MKKFMAIVMCLAMALSMMTVVSFAADSDYYVGANGEITVAPGAAVDIPVYVLGPNKADYEEGTMVSIGYFAPEGLTFSVTPGVMATADISYGEDFVIAFKDPVTTMSLTSPAFTLNVTAPEVEGKYVFTVDYDNTFLFNGAYDPIENYVYEDIVINVEAEEVEPSIGAVDTTVPSANEDGVLKVLELIGNPTEFGIKYVGEDADYAGTEFPGRIEAETSATYAAVEVIGLDDAFEAYAR